MLSKPSKQPSNNNGYTASDIYVLEGLEPVRKRPGMYIGTTGIDGLHHLIWEVFDNSVTHDTPVMVRQDGIIQMRPIGQLIDDYFEQNGELVETSKDGSAQILRKNINLESLSFSKDQLGLQYTPVYSLIRHKVNSNIYRVTLQNGRQVDITPYHSLFTLKRGNAEAIRGSDLKIGTPVIVPKDWPEVENPIRAIDLLNAFLALPDSITSKILIYGLSPLLRSEQGLTERIQSKVSADKTVIQRKQDWRDYIRHDYLPLNYLRNLTDADYEMIRAAYPLIGNKSKNGYKLPLRLNISRKLVELLGLFAAEGSIVEYKKGYRRLVWSLGAHEKSLIDYTISAIQEVFGYRTVATYVHDTARTVSIASTTIALIFQHVIKTGENSSNKSVPLLIFNLERELRERYLIAYLSGDGYPTRVWIDCLTRNVSLNQAEKRKFNATAKSRTFISSFAYLLASLNKTYSFLERKRGNPKNKLISISYHGVKKYRQINSQQIAYALDFYWNTKASWFTRVPTEEIVQRVDWHEPVSFSLSLHGGITGEKITALSAQRRIVLYPGAERFLKSDLGVLRVKKIEKIVYTHPWVYDISVPNGENFVGGAAPICLHNSLDEAMGGYADHIVIKLLPDDRVWIKDNGRGIPVDKHKQTGVSALETVMTTLHAGGKFGGESYKVSTGLHGVGVSVVNALSKWLRVEVHRDGGAYEQVYEQGNAKKAVKQIGKSKEHGTIGEFEADPEIFKEIAYDVNRIKTHVRQQAYLTKGIRIDLIDQREKLAPTYSFYFDGGIVSYVRFLNRNLDLKHPNIFYVGKEINNMFVEVALQYTNELQGHELSFANNVHTAEGGSHLTGFRTVITRVLNDYARKSGYLKEKEENLTGEDVREGLTSIVSVRLREAQFEGQTKAKLGTPEARNAVETIMGAEFADWLERNPSDGRDIMAKVILASKARMAAKAARDTVIRKGALEGFTLPGKLADCSSKDPAESEIFIVEGESAGGSSKMGRNRRTQAILPLKGKILNDEKSSIDKMLASEEIRALVVAMGTAIADEFDIAKLRYHKIVIMTDADVDGAHIRTLLLTLFYRYFPKVIEAGHLYIAQPPLYQIRKSGAVQYAYNDEEKDKILGKGDGYAIQRYKGLGEMNPDQLWETTMNPDNRVLLQVNVEDAEEADHIFDVLMGSEVMPRKKFIQTHAKNVKNLDI